MQQIVNRRGRCLGLLFILCISAVLLSPIFISNLGFKKNFDADDYRVVILPKELDKNANKIHDSFESEVNFASSEDVEAIVSFKQAPAQNDRDYIESLGGQWITEYRIIFAAHIKIPALKLPELANSYSVSSVSGNFKYTSSLYLSNYQVRARNSTWLQQYNGLNLTGSPYFATAVLDTGIDATHPDLSSRVIAWKDFIGAAWNVSGDEYANATDYGHHGTHVAGIISGQGNSSKTGYLNVTHSGVIAEQNGYYYYGPAFIKSDSNSRNLILKQAWNESFTTYIGYTHETGTGNYPNIANNSQVSLGISAAGQYVSAVGGNRQEDITRDIPFTAQIDIPVSIPSDGYGAAAGIAPNSKIVAVKVLDDNGPGTTAQILNGLQWCADHKTTYNITVINLSLGSDVIDSNFDNAIATMVTTHGIVVVASAGNDGAGAARIGSPGSAPYAITVGAVNRLNEIAVYSSVGNPSDNNIIVKPDITAPGGSWSRAPGSTSKYGNAIFSTDSNYDDQFSGNHGTEGWIDNKVPYDRYPDDYTGMQGTSMAAPHVSGIAQLLIQRLAADNGGNWTWSAANAAKVKQLLLMATSESAAIGMGGEENQNPILNRGAKDYTEGWGRVDVLSAINLATPITSFQSKSITFSNDSIGPRVEALNLHLTQNIQYEFNLRIDDSNSDIDLFLYQATPGSYGEPVELQRSATVGFGASESITFTPTSTGNYYLIARWANGTGTSHAEIYSPAINDALDNYDLNFITDGAQPWFYQTTTTHDGVDAMQSGPITHNQASQISTNVYGPGKIGFYWKVDSQATNDVLQFRVNSNNIATKSGNDDWSYYEYILGFGSHSISWIYSKDGSVSSGADAAWLDQVTFTSGTTGFNTTIFDITPNPSMNGQISLDWDDVAGATKYLLYRETSSFNDVSGLTPIAEPTISSYMDTIITNGTYYYRVVANNGTLNSGLSNEVSVSVQIEPTMESQQVVISNILPNPSPNGIISLDWNDIIGVTKYYVYRHTSSFSSVEGLSPIAEPTVSNYEDTLTVNETYFYRVIATNDTHNTTLSNEVSVSVQILPTMENQEVIIAEILPNPSPHGIISLNWNDIIGATKYYVYRSTSSFSSVAGLTPIAEPTVSDYEDIITVNETYYYRVIATNGTHNTTLSNEESVIVQILPTMANQDVVIESISPNPSPHGMISLNWNDIEGATKYYVYRNTSSFSSVAGLTPLAEPTVSNYEDIITVNGTYFYRVIATNGTHNTSLSIEVSVIVEILPTMENQAVIISDISPNPSSSGVITLDWNDIIGATQYYVYRSTSSFSDVSGLTPIAQPLTSTYEDTLTVNGTYYYRIIATNGTHNTSLSDIVSVVVAIPPTVADQTVVISNIVPNPSTSGLIILEWNEIIGATTYYVYRHTSSFSDVSGLTPIAEIGGTAYYDTLTANGTYYYRVIASDGTMNSSISNEVSVIVEIPAFEDNQIFLNANLTGITNITLIWNEVPGATMYYIFMSESEFSDVSGLTPFAEFTGNLYSYIATKNGTFYYRIVATNGVANTTASNMANVTIVIPPPVVDPDPDQPGEDPDPDDGDGDGNDDGPGEIEIPKENIQYGLVGLGIAAVILVCAFRKPKK